MSPQCPRSCKHCELALTGPPHAPPIKKFHLELFRFQVEQWSGRLSEV